MPGLAGSIPSGVPKFLALAPATRTVFTDDLPETVATADAQNATVLTPEDESAAIFDTVSAAAIFAPAGAETAAATDTVSAIATFTVAIAETAGAADTVGATAQYAVTVAESAAATDTTSATAQFTVSAAEVASILDSPSAVASFVAEGFETVGAFDSPDAVVDYIGGLLEAAAAVDTTDAVVIPPGGGTTYDVTISEVTGIDDLTDAIVLSPVLPGRQFGGIGIGGGGGMKDRKRSGQFADDWEPPLMMWKPVVSSDLDRMVYDPRRGRLCIAFKSGDSYTYFGVPPSVAGSIPRAPSPGRYFHRKVRTKYPYRKREK